MKLLPAPLLSLSLLALWVMLQGSVDPGTVMLGALVAIMVPLMTQTLRPTRVRMRRPGKVLLLIGRVFVDVIRSNFEVAWHVWFFRSHPPRTQWVVIPLQLRTPAALAALSAIAAIVPGTVWSELSMDRSRLLFHVFHVPEGQDFAAWHKERYEVLLMEIFE